MKKADFFATKIDNTNVTQHRLPWPQKAHSHTRSRRQTNRPSDTGTHVSAQKHIHMTMVEQIRTRTGQVHHIWIRIIHASTVIVIVIDKRRTKQNIVERRRATITRQSSQNENKLFYEKRIQKIGIRRTDRQSDERLVTTARGIFICSMKKRASIQQVYKHIYHTAVCYAYIYDCAEQLILSIDNNIYREINWSDYF